MFAFLRQTDLFHEGNVQWCNVKAVMRHDVIVKAEHDSTAFRGSVCI